MEQKLRHLSFASLFIFALGIFTSVSLSALGHILLLIPGVYFSYKNFRKNSISKSTWCLLLLVAAIFLSVVFIIAEHLVLKFLLFFGSQLPKKPSDLGTPIELPQPKIINLIFIKKIIFQNYLS